MEADDNGHKEAWWDMVAKADVPLVALDAQEQGELGDDELVDPHTDQDHVVEVQLHRVHQRGGQQDMIQQDCIQEPSARPMEEASGHSTKRQASKHASKHASASRAAGQRSTKSAGDVQRWSGGAHALLPYGVVLAAKGNIPVVVQVTPGSSGEGAGVKVGDVVMQVGGVDVDSVLQVQRAVHAW
jgi:hypothetical protein